VDRGHGLAQAIQVHGRTGTIDEHAVILEAALQVGVSSFSVQ
jgi:hypothetical protein